MILVYATYPGDEELALKNVKWWNELGGCPGHFCLFIPDDRCKYKDEILAELKTCFSDGAVFVFPGRAQIDGWPEGANYFFRTATSWLANSPLYKSFFWMEPDAIPLKEGWIEDLVKEYTKCGKPFMGDRVEVEDIPLHMSGVGFYPNPLHQYSGEAYRAYNTAWDMAGKDQIVPRAYFTKLIEHAWKHPSFTMDDELKTQIRPEAVLFHSSKDGSLIDLLQSKRRGNKSGVGYCAIPDNHTSAHQKEPEHPGSPSPSFTCDIFIRTYPEDYPWLKYCLRSVNKFCTGFRKIWIVSPKDNPTANMVGYEWKQMNDETEDGYLAQQITKMYADVVTDYQPDYILHLDSDVIFTKPTTPSDFLSEDKVIWYYTAYDNVQTPWKPITEKFMGGEVDFEFMRRFPIMVPRWLYPRIREFCYRVHHITITDYIKMQPHRAFSEFNVMGAYLWKFHRERISWHNTMDSLPDAMAKQYHSWGGLTDSIKQEIECYLSGEKPAVGVPVDSIPEVTVRSPEPPPQGIKELSNGLWVFENDTHVSRWVEQQDRLDHDQNTLPFILPHIHDGDTVIDAGAFIGDHTVAYLKKVGKTGKVHAFEPNPIAMACLKHNLSLDSNRDSYFGHGYGLSTYEMALGDTFKNDLPLSGNNNNAAGAYLGTDQQCATVKMMALDELDIAPDFIKWDIEGCEVKALKGAEKTILKHKPVMVMEVNYEALKRQGSKVGDLFAILESWEYNWKIIQENCGLTSPMYDIICNPKKSPEVVLPGNGESDLSRCIAPPPPVTPLKDMLQAVLFLKDFAAKSLNHRLRVMQNLSKNGLTPRYRPKKRKKK